MLQLLLEGTSRSHEITQNQQQILSILQQVQTIIRVQNEIPAQVPLSKPVILLDARGRYFPFHLEFIDSAEVRVPSHTQNLIHTAILKLVLQAFTAVLKVRFRDVGLRKIEKGQFALQDTRRKNALNLALPWKALIRPGQHISMSMIFRRKQFSTGICPNCGEENEESEAEEVEW